MKYCKRIVACLICCLLVCAFVFPVSAAGNVDFTQECTLTIEFRHDGAAVAGAQFEVYRVGDISERGWMNLTGAFENYLVRLNATTNKEFQAAADTLSGYAQRDGIEPDYTVVTDANGVARLTGLEVGLYLIVSQPYAADGGKYVTDPQLWSLPYRLNTADAWNYSLELTPKYEFIEDTVEPVTVKVLKQWDDAGNEELRPASIKINLLCDGTVFDSVTLTAADNWRYTWEDLEPNHEWTVVEDTLENYTVTVQKEGITFVMKNSYVEPPTEPTEPKPTEPKPTEPKPTEPESTGPKIPQTGMLWWPVPVLLVMGLALVALGIASRKKGHDES